MSFIPSKHEHLPQRAVGAKRQPHTQQTPPSNTSPLGDKKRHEGVRVWYAQCAALQRSRPQLHSLCARIASQRARPPLPAARTARSAAQVRPPRQPLPPRPRPGTAYSSPPCRASGAPM